MKRAAARCRGLGEVPFGRYYGSVDSTPLFVMLAGAYEQRTGDLELIRELWPNIEEALGWMERYGDLDGDQFLEYDRKSVNGLINQGWKDSADSVFHEGRASCRRADRTRRSAGLCLCRVARSSTAGAVAGRTRAGKRAGRQSGKICVPRSNVISGTNGSASTCWRSTARSALAACGRRTRAMRCSAASHPPIAPIASPTRCWRPTSSRIGASARLRPTRPATIR